MRASLSMLPGSSVCRVLLTGNLHKCSPFTILQRTSGLEIRHLQFGRANCSSSLSEPHSGARNSLIDWVKQQGGTAAGIEVTREGTDLGYGLKAAQDVAAGSTLIVLPKRCLLTYDESSSRALLALIAQVPQELWGAKLALQVLAHRVQGDASPFAPYIRSLPVGVPGLPMFFSREAVAALEYPPLSQQVARRCRWLLDFAQRVLAPLAGGDGSGNPFTGVQVDANALGWALAVVTSRAFRVRGPQFPAAMLPLIDLCNHSFDPNCEVQPAGGGVKLVALRDVQRGQPLLLSYGKLGNDFLLLDYGFVVAGNPYDRVSLQFSTALMEVGAAVGDLPNVDLSPKAWQLAALQALQLEGPKANLEVQVGGPQGVDRRLLTAARVLCCGAEAEWGAAGGSTALAKSLAPAIEVKARRLLLGLCSFLLSRFPTTVEQDVAAASQQGVPADLQLALTFRAAKKQLLVDAMGSLKQQIKDLEARKPLGESPQAAPQFKGFGPKKP